MSPSGIEQNRSRLTNPWWVLGMTFFFTLLVWAGLRYDEART
jgi:hypothetical protein